MTKREQLECKKAARCYIDQAKHYIKKLQWEGQILLTDDSLVTTRSFRGFKNIVKHCKYDVEVVYFVDPREE
jgi:hypothetical protein